MQNVILWEMPEIPNLPFWSETSRFWQIFPASHSRLIFSQFLKLFLFFVSPVFSALLCPFSVVSQPFLPFGIWAWACNSFGSAVFPLTGISKCRKMASKRHISYNFSQGSMPLEPPRGSCLQRSWAQLCCPKNLPFLLNTVGISEMLIHYQ